MNIEDYTIFYPQSENLLYNASLAEYRTAEYSDDSEYKLQFHQELTRRYLSPETLNNRLLIFGLPGTGKTCQMLGPAISAVEMWPEVYTQRILVITPPSQILSFKDNLRKCMPKYAASASDEVVVEQQRHYYGYGKYRKEKWVDPRKSGAEKVVKKQEKYPWNDAKINQDFEFLSHDGIKKYLLKSDENELANLAKNRVIIIDEVHMLKKKINESLIDTEITVSVMEAAEKYTLLHKFCHASNDNIIILGTGTPGIEFESEIDDIMNLILPLNKQLSNPTIAEFEAICKGYVSFINKPYDPTRVLEQQGELHTFPNGVTETLYKIKPTTSEMQYINKQKKTLGQGHHADTARQKEVVLNIFPCDFDQLISSLQNEGRLDKKLALIKENASKVYKYIEHLFSKNNANTKSFLYSNYKTEVIERIAKLLTSLGFERFEGKTLPTTKKRRFIMLTGTSMTDKRDVSFFASFEKQEKTTNDLLMQIYNHPDNWNGQYIQTVIGSEVTNIGLSFLDTITSFILDGWWRYYRILQAIARIDRNNGLKEYIKNMYGNNSANKSIKQQVYKLVLDYEGSVDMAQYEEAKTLYVQNIIPRLQSLKRISFDCNFLKKINQWPAKFDYKLECDYTLCNYDCYGVSEAEYNNLVVKHENYRALYADVAKKLFNPIIFDVFKIKSIYILDELYAVIKSHFPKFNPQIELVILVLNDLVCNKTIILNRLGFPCIMCSENNYYYLHQGFQTVDLPASYYNELIITPSDYSLDQHLHKENLDVLLTTLNNINTELACKNEINKLIKLKDRDALAELIEYFVLNDIGPKWSSFIIREVLFSNIFIKDGAYVHNILGTKEFRIFRNNKWETINEKSEEKIVIKSTATSKKPKTITFYTTIKEHIDTTHDNNVNLLYQDGKIPLIGQIIVLEDYKFKILNKTQDKLNIRSNMKATGRTHFESEDMVIMLFILITNPAYLDLQEKAPLVELGLITNDFVWDNHKEIISKQVFSKFDAKKLPETLSVLLEKDTLTPIERNMLNICTHLTRVKFPKDDMFKIIEKTLKARNYLVFI